MLKILLGLIFLLVLGGQPLKLTALAAEVPTLKSPASLSTTDDTSPTLSWSWTGNCPESGSCFRVQVDDQADFVSLRKDYYTSNTSYSPQLEEGTWYWQVKAKDSSGWSGWSQVWNFTIAQTSSPTTEPTPSQTPAPTSQAPSSDNLKITLSEIYPAPNSGE